MIRALKTNDIEGLNILPPKSWYFDFEAFLKQFSKEDYFHAFVLVKNDKLVGTGNVFINGKIAWLANIIIKENWRGKGLGLEMTNFLVDFLKRKGCTTQLLIATELGLPVYQKAGFRPLSTYHCYNSIKSARYESHPSVRKLLGSDKAQVITLDLLINAENRQHLIDKYYTSGYGFFTSENDLIGCYLPDFERGLVLAKSALAGFELLKLKHAEKGRRSLLPVENKAGISSLEEMGLIRGESCVRMVLGIENEWKPEFIYSYGSGYCG